MREPTVVLAVTGRVGLISTTSTQRQLGSEQSDHVSTRHSSVPVDEHKGAVLEA